MVIVVGPVAAVLLALNVNVLVVAVVEGLNEAVTPAGDPAADKLTLPLKPLRSVTETMLVPLAPCVMVTLLGDADREKSGEALTVKLTVVEWVRLPLVPVMVTVAVPVAAVLLAVNVSRLVFVVLAGVNVAVTPDGNPDADKFTLPLNPFKSVSVIVLLLLEPCVTVTAVGEAESEKSGVAAVV